MCRPSVPTPGRQSRWIKASLACSTQWVPGQPELCRDPALPHSQRKKTLVQHICSIHNQLKISARQSVLWCRQTGYSYIKRLEPQRPTLGANREQIERGTSELYSTSTSCHPHPIRIHSRWAMHMGTISLILTKSFRKRAEHTLQKPGHVRDLT